MPCRPVRSRALTAAAGTILAVCTALPASGSPAVVPGTLDSSFGVNGLARNHFAITENSAAVVALADDSIAMAGLVRSGTGTDQMAVMHVGTGGTGWAMTTLSCGLPGEGAVAMAAASGRLVVAGYSRTYGYPDAGFCVGAVDPVTGQVDTGFGSGGAVRTAFPGHAVLPRAMAVDAGGGVLVVGDDGDAPPAGEDARVFAAHYLANGSLDAAFGSGGTAMVDLGGGYDSVGGVVATPVGWVITGTNTTSKTLVLTQLTPSGVVDASFGTNGLAQMSAGGSPIQANDLVRDSGGGLVVSTYAGYNDFGVVRFTGTGARDMTFGTGGGTRINFGASPTDFPNDTPTGLVIDETGRIVIGGTTSFGSGSAWVMARLLANGSLDTSFGSTGLVRTHPAVYDAANGLAIDSQHRLLQTGTVSANDATGSDVAVARFIGGGGPPAADIVAHIRAYADPITPGGTSTYDVGAENLGPSGAANVTVHFAVPSGTSLGPTTSSCVYTAGTGDVACPLGNLPSGGNGLATITINVPASQGASLIAAVSAGSDTPDPDSSNNTDSATVAVRDVTAPTVQITSPANSATYELGAVVSGAYSCSDDRGTPTCTGPVASGGDIDTSGVGSHTFTVSARDGSGNTGSLSVSYSVVSTTSGSVTDGGTVATTTPVDASTPVGVSVTVPSGYSGAVDITETGDVTATAPANYRILGQQLNIDAPAATWDHPLALTFTLDATLLAGQPVASIDILRNGIVVADCPGSTTALPPDADPDGYPCISARQVDGTTSDGMFTILTPHASTWNFARAEDTAPPAISISRPVDGATYALGQSDTASYACSDGQDGSGLASCAGPVSSGARLDTNSLGAKTFTVAAVDNAGNTANRTVSYRVVYAFRGFLSPVVNPPMFNVVPAGKGVPLRFSLSGFQGNDVVSAVASANISCPTSTRASKVSQTVTGDGSLRYTTSTDQYEYRWATSKSWLKTCRSATITLRDGTTHQALFQFN